MTFVFFLSAGDKNVAGVQLQLVLDIGLHQT